MSNHEDNNSDVESTSGGSSTSLKQVLAILGNPLRTDFPVSPVNHNDVCYKAIKHPGTVAWRDAVKKYSDRPDLYPTWNDRVYTLIREELANVNIGRFLVLLDDQGNYSKTIKAGQWYQATDDEILTKTRDRFFEDRKERTKEARNATGQTLPVDVSSPSTTKLDQFQRSLRGHVNFLPSLHQELLSQSLNNETMLTLMTTKLDLEHLLGFFNMHLTQRHPASLNQFQPHNHVAANAPNLPTQQHAPNVNFFPPVPPFGGELFRQVTTVPVNTASSIPSPEQVSSQSPKLLPSQVASRQGAVEDITARRRNSRDDPDDADQLDIHLKGLEITPSAQSNAAQTRKTTPTISAQSIVVQTCKTTPPAQSSAAQTCKTTPRTSAQSVTSQTRKATPDLSPSSDFTPEKTNPSTPKAVGSHEVAPKEGKTAAPLDPTMASARQEKKPTSNHASAFIENITITLDYKQRKAQGNVAAVAGESLTGTIVVNAGDISGDHQAGYLRLRIVGKEDNFFNSSPVVRRSSRDVFDQSAVIRDLSKNGLVQGVNKIPFSFPLPENLPSTTEIVLKDISNVKVSFEIQVIHEVGGNEELKLKRPFMVQSRPLLGNSGPVRWGPKTHKLRSMGFVKKGSLSLGVRLAASQIGRGQTLEMSIACRNHSSADIKSVQVKLMEQIQWFDEEFRDLQPYYTESIVLVKVDDLKLPWQTRRGKGRSQEIHNKALDDHQEPSYYPEMIEELQSAVNKCAMTIPKQCHDSYHGKMVTVSHYIEIKLITNFSTDNFGATIPLTVVGSLPILSQSPVVGSAAQPRSSRSVATNTSAGSTVVASTKGDGASILTENTQSTPALRTVSTALLTVDSSQDGQPAQSLLNRLLVEMKVLEDSHRAISEKVGDDAWMELFASLNAENFGCIIEHVDTDVDRPRVAELVAPHVQFFTCQHAAMAIQKTSFRVSMAKVLVPLCHDKFSQMSTILKELDEWDLNVLNFG